MPDVLAPALAASLAAASAPAVSGARPSRPAGARPASRLWRLALARWRTGAPGGSVSLSSLLLQALAVVVLLVLALGLAGSPARAADDDDSVVDPPARVGRVARTEGWVTLQSHDNDESIDSPRNWPLTTGDVVATGDFANAELRVGASVFRIGENARLQFVRLDDDAIEIHLQRGSLALLLNSYDAAREVTVSSAAGRFLPLGEGFFRIDASPTPGATAWRSGLQVDQAGATFTLKPGQYAELYLDGGWRPGSPVSDEFAQWSMRPDTPAPASEAALLPPDMTGVEDLRDHGDWQRSPDWGMVWYPRTVAVDWAPYREGRWAWVAPWGWTWVDDAPWGFAPFHYGRWVQWRGRWGWCPGEYTHRPVYSPALVAWADQPPPRSGVSININIGRSMVWFPLAPREMYVPSYRATPRYRDVVNRPYVRQPMPRADERRFDHGPRRIGTPPVYRYARVEGARTMLPRNVFEQARKPVDAVRRHVEPPRFRGQPPPSREMVPIRITPDRNPGRQPDGTPGRPGDRADRGERGRDGAARDNRDNRDERGVPARPQAPAIVVRPVPGAPVTPSREAPSVRPVAPQPQAQQPSQLQPQIQPPAQTGPAQRVPVPQAPQQRADRPGDNRGGGADGRPDMRPPAQRDDRGERPERGERGEPRNDGRGDNRSGLPRGDNRGRERAPASNTPAPAAAVVPAIVAPSPAQPQVQAPAQQQPQAPAQPRFQPAPQQQQQPRPGINMPAPMAPAPARAIAPAPAPAPVPAPMVVPARPAPPAPAPRAPAAPAAPVVVPQAPAPAAVAPAPVARPAPARPAPAVEPAPERRPGGGNSDQRQRRGDQQR
ncbi:MAG: hypothetical protein IPG93_08290 [Burkholderiales bacterium]|nr:hypothetical protein [Burkholderiales bacterium]